MFFIQIIIITHLKNGIIMLIRDNEIILLI